MRVWHPAGGAGARTRDHRNAPGQLRSFGPCAWLLVIAIIGAVQLVRQQWFAAGLFLLAATVMGIDLVHRGADGARRQGQTPAPDHDTHGARRLTNRCPRRLPLTVLLPAAALAAVALTALTRHSGAMVAVLVPVGVVTMALGWPGDRSPEGGHRWPPALRRLAWAWAAIWIAGGLWELAQVLLVNLGQDTAAVPLSDLLEPVLETRIGQGAFAAAWLLAGVYLLRRGRGS